MKKFRSVICLLLVLVMALGLAACGSQSSEGSKESGEVKGGEKKEEAAGKEEMVYVAEFTPVDVPEEVYLNPRCYTADGFYATSYEKTGERELAEGEELEYEGQLDIYANVLYFVSREGKLTKLDKYRQLESIEDTEDRVGYNSGSDLIGLCLGDDGNLIAIEQRYVNWFEGSQEEMYSDNSWNRWHYENSYLLRSLAKDGAELDSHEIAFAGEENSYFNTSALYRDDEGNVLVTCEMFLLAVAPDGSIAYQLESDEYLNGVTCLKDGRLGVTRWGTNGMELILLDSKDRTFGEKISLPSNAYDLLTGGGDYDFFYRNGSNLNGVNIETGANDKILNWINCNVNGDNIGGLHVEEDGTITGVLSSYRGEKRDTEFVTLRQVPASTLPEKQVITLAVMYLNYNLSDQLIDFNRHSDTVRIELIDYSEYNTEEDYTAGQTKLTTEILSGKMPDILALSGLPYSQLAAKGLLEDLYPYLDSDKELKRDDFFPTVLHAMEAHGGLYRICPSFSIQSLIGAPSVVGEEPGWTYDEFKAALASMPEGCTALDQYITRDSVLQSLVALDMNDVVDWSTGQCSFDSQEFIDILEFANSFQAEFDWENYEWSEEESTPIRIAQGKQMLLQNGIFSIDDVLYNDLYFGGSSTYIGWPTNNGVGNMITLDDGAFAMSASCANKEAAWEFLRNLLTEDYQQQLWGLPVNVHVFNKKLEEAMTPEYIKDESGNYVLDENGEKIQQSRGGIGFGDGSTYEVYALSQEQADKLLNVINTTTKVMDQNDSIFAIVQEQAAAYFAGQKSAAEVARLVQSKANIYVNEQR